MLVLDVRLDEWAIMTLDPIDRQYLLLLDVKENPAYSTMTRGVVIINYCEQVLLNLALRRSKWVQLHPRGC